MEDYIVVKSQIKSKIEYLKCIRIVENFTLGKIYKLKTDDEHVLISSLNRKIYNSYIINDNGVKERFYIPSHFYFYYFKSVTSEEVRKFKLDMIKYKKDN